MIKLLRAGFRRYLHSYIFWLAIAVTVGFAVVCGMEARKYYFEDFYEDFDRQRAEEMLQTLGIPLKAKFKTLSKGAREKVQLALVMSRRAKLYLLDEPIAGVDPAARDYILKNKTIFRFHI